MFSSTLARIFFFFLNKEVKFNVQLSPFSIRRFCPFPLGILVDAPTVQVTVRLRENKKRSCLFSTIRTGVRQLVR